MVFVFAGMKRNSDGETGPAPKRHRPMGDTELRLLVYSKVNFYRAINNEIKPSNYIYSYKYDPIDF